NESLMSRRPTMRWALAVLGPASLLPTAGSAAPAPPPFPAAGTTAIYREARELAAGLSQPPNAAGQTTAPVLATDRTAFRSLRRAAPNNPLAHPGWTEVFYIIDGGGVFESGGTVTRTAGSESVVYAGAAQQ